MFPEVVGLVIFLGGRFCNESLLKYVTFSFAMSIFPFITHSAAERIFLKSNIMVFTKVCPHTSTDNKVRELILEGLFIMNYYQLDKQSAKFTIWKY